MVQQISGFLRPESFEELVQLIQERYRDPRIVQARVELERDWLEGWPTRTMTSVLEAPDPDSVVMWGHQVEWTVPEYRQLYVQHLMEQLFPFHLFNLEGGSLKGVRLSRFIWLRDNHLNVLLQMMVADVLQEHLRETERRVQERYGQLMDLLVEQRHLENRVDVVVAHPEMTDERRYWGLVNARRDAMEMAVRQVVESF